MARVCVAVSLLMFHSCAFLFFQGSTAAPTQPLTPVTSCSVAKHDLVFVLDSSGSIALSDFQSMKDFVKDFLVEADIDGGNVRVSLITYNSEAHPRFHLNEYKTKADVYDAIDNVPYESGGTNTADALQTMREEMFSRPNGDRPNVNNIAIVLTDGESSVNADRTIPEAEQARAEKIHIYAIGIGLSNTTELDGIASKPVDENRFAIQDFTELQDLKRQVFASLCSIDTFATPLTSGVKVNIKPSGLVWVLEDRPLTLTCTADDWSIDDQMPTWRKDAAVIDETTAPEYTVVNTVDEANSRVTSVLSRASANVGEYHEYMCAVGREEDSSVQLTVFSVSYKDVNISVGFETTLECQPQTEYKQVRTSWLKDNVPIEDIPSLKDRLSIGQDNESILLEDTKSSDGGVYTCVIEMNPGHEGNSQVFHVNMTAYGQPYIQHADTPEMLLTITNTSVTILCPAKGQPPPKVIWFRGDEVLEPAPRITLTEHEGVDSGKLEIANTTSEDIGKYTCTADNNRGKASLTFDVTDPLADINSGSRSEVTGWMLFGCVLLGIAELVKFDVLKS